jgi:hypothetical protein
MPAFNALSMYAGLRSGAFAFISSTSSAFVEYKGRPKLSQKCAMRISTALTPNGRSESNTSPVHIGVTETAGLSSGR